MLALPAANDYPAASLRAAASARSLFFSGIPATAAEITTKAAGFRFPSAVMRNSMKRLKQYKHIC